MSLLVDDKSRLSKALELHPDVLQYIVSLNPHDFKRLLNPLMRKLMSPRITIARIATMTQTDITELVASIHNIAGVPLAEEDIDELRRSHATRENYVAPTLGKEPPAWAMVDDPVVVDLLESDERLDSDPILPINRALNTHEVGTVVVIKHKWEPQPLYDIWDAIGVEHFAVQIAEDQYWIFVRKTLNRKER